MIYNEILLLHLIQNTNPTFFFAIKNSPNWTKLETGVGVNNDIWVNDLYEKIVDINNLKSFRLLEFFHNAA